MCLLWLIVTAFPAAETSPELAAYLQQSIEMWDKVVPWFSLGSVPVTSNFDAETLVTELSKDITEAGRYKEFEYLFNYYKENKNKGNLVCRIIEARPPSPGFWPARIDDTQSALVINAADLEYLAKEPALLKASFLRAVAALYYLKEAAFPTLYFNGRNVLYEFSALMTGNFVESIYLNEIVFFNNNSPIANNWHTWLIDSAKNDNFVSIARNLYGFSMNYAYHFLSILSKLSSYQQIMSMLNTMNDIPVDLVDNIKKGLFTRFALTPKQVEDGIIARTILMTDPWILLVISRVIPPNNKEIQNLVNSTYKTMDLVRSYYKHLEPPLLDHRQAQLDCNAFWAPEPSMLSYTEPAKIEKGTAAALSVPGAVKTIWYRECDSFAGNQYRGYIPLPEQEALATAAYRFSYGADGSLMAVEYFNKGHLQVGYALQDAARIIIIREGRTEIWRWEDASGRLVSNDSGFALMKVETLQGSEDEQAKGLRRLTFTFYDRDGRRVFHSSGAWSIERRISPQGFEDSYYDDRGQLSENYFGYAKVWYSETAGTAMGSKNRINRYEYRYFDKDGNPACSQFLGVHGTLEQHTENGSNYSVEISYINAQVQPSKIFDNSWMQRKKFGKDLFVYENLDREGKPIVSLFGYASIQSTIVNGMIVADAFYDAAGKAVNSLAGYHKRKMSYTDRGDIAELSYFDARNKPVLGMDGIHRQVYKYDKNGYLEELFFYGPDGKLINDYSGAAHIRWYKDELGRTYAVDAWDSAGNRLSSGAGKDI
ncbi:hypothetical protein [Gracilinema caldarium]|uniref:hypothetical protein n=1 Tax=Gracilinema caldarium TaxID=215591 RepID=UPI0026F27ED3|nr:hypothetical protein [Gracilinema caldarium]